MEELGQTGGATRRTLLKGAAVTVLSASGAGWLVACGDDNKQGAATGTSGTPATSGEPVRGGTLRFGQLGSGPGESMNPVHYSGNIAIARQLQIFDNLVRMKPDLSGWEPALATEVTPNGDFTSWTIRLREGVTWHDGKPLTADDLVYTMQGWLDPKNDPYSFIGVFMEKGGVKKLDDLTVRFAFAKPYADPFGTLASPPCLVLQEGETEFAKPQGTGPFKLDSFTPGTTSVMSRNEDYWDEGGPYVDQLEMLSIADPAALVNALLSSKIDVAAGFDYAQAKAQQESDQINLLITKQAGGMRFYMDASNALFKDVRVRQALRMVPDRQALIDSALLGFGTVGNDLMGPGLPYYPSDFGPRERDIEQAKSLLKAAGAEDLRFALHTVPNPGFVAAATLFAEQAKEAGITIQVKQEQLANYYDPSKLYGKMEMAQDTNIPLPSIPANMALTYAKNAPFNPENWRFDWFDELMYAAYAKDGAEGEQRWHDVFQALWDKGADITWAQPEILDATAKKVKGIEPHMQLNVGNYRLKDAWIEA